MADQQPTNYGPLAAYLTHITTNISEGRQPPPPPPPDVLSILRDIRAPEARARAATAMAPWLLQSPIRVINDLGVVLGYFLPETEAEAPPAATAPESPPSPTPQQRASLGRVLALSLGEILGTAHLVADLYYDLRTQSTIPLTDEEQAVIAQMRRLGWRPLPERGE